MLTSKNKVIAFGGGIMLVAVIALAGWQLYVHFVPSSGIELLELKNNGSTNTPGWDLVINDNGSGKLTVDKGAAKSYRAGTFNASGLRQALQSMQLDQTNVCMRSASFGADEDLTYKGTIYTGVDCILDGQPTELSNQVNAAISTANVPERKQ